MNRKLLTVLLLCVISLGLYAGSGDVNGDGKINAADIVELVNYLNGNQSGNFIEDAADVNEDGIVNSSDVDAIANLIMGEHPVLITSNEIQLTDSENYQQIDVVIESDSKSFFNSASVSILDNSSSWLYLSRQMCTSVNGKVRGVYTFDVSPNVMANSREGEIVINSEKYNFYEIISVKTEPYFRACKKEYHLVNQGTRYLYVEPETSIDFLEAGGWVYKVIDCEGDWLRYEDGSVQYDNNWTGKERKASLIVKTANYNYADTVTVIHHPATIVNGSQRHTIACQPSGDIVEIPIIGNTI